MASLSPSPENVRQTPQRRKRASDRVDELVTIADETIRQTRSADLSLRAVADRLNISRALIYAYFNDRSEMLDAVLDRHVALLDAAGFSQAAAEGTLMERTLACSRILLDHQIRRGATVELIVREEAVARQLKGLGIRSLRHIQRQLLRTAVHEFRMGTRESYALVELLTVIPLEAARRVEQDGVNAEVAHNVCQRLIRSSIEAQIPHASALP